MPDHRYYRGSRAADSILEEHGNDLPAWATQAGVELDHLIHLANQRALRVVLVSFMGVDPDEMKVGVNTKLAYHIPPEFKQLIPVLAAAFVDGWAARHHLQPETGV